MKNWEKQNILNSDNQLCEAISPLIISASRATDIPAFYSKWLMERLKAGYLVWKNPFNQKKQYISLQKSRLFVFWSKNPKPIIKYLDELDKYGINYYFQFTLNDYENEKYEPQVPKLENRIETFKMLSDKIGKEKVIWRFDPLILTTKIDVNTLLRKIEFVGNQLHKYTDKLVFSFADISIYRKVQSNLKKIGIDYLEFNEELMIEFSKGLKMLNQSWNLQLATCCEKVDLEKYGIEHNRCIDDKLIIKLFSNDEILMKFLGYKNLSQDDLFEKGDDKQGKNLKDKGQRKVCGCIISKDIGEYNTCSHLCIYCYANTSNTAVINNLTKYKYINESIIE